MLLRRFALPGPPVMTPTDAALSSTVLALGGTGSSYLDTVEEFLVGEGRWVAREGLGEARSRYGGTAVAASLVCGKIPNIISPPSSAPAA